MARWRRRGWRCSPPRSIAAAEVQTYFRVGKGASGYDIGLSLALFGAGHLVGISVGMALLLGVVIAWGGAVPILTAMTAMAGRA